MGTQFLEHLGAYPDRRLDLWVQILEKGTPCSGVFSMAAYPFAMAER
jgi:hypothetical protein